MLRIGAGILVAVLCLPAHAEEKADPEGSVPWIYGSVSYSLMFEEKPETPEEWLQKLQLDRPLKGEPQKALIAAVIRGDVDGVAAALAKGAKPDWKRPGPRDWEGCPGSVADTSVLTIAVDYGYEPVVALLLSKGARPDTRVNWGPAPMYLSTLNVAISRGRTAILKRLLDAGADPNFTCSLGYFVEAPLKTAVQADNLEAFELLLQKGAVVSRQDAKGVLDADVAMVALSLGRVRFVESLVKRGLVLNAEQRAFLGILTDDPARIASGIAGLKAQLVENLEFLERCRMTPGHCAVMSEGVRKGLLIGRLVATAKQRKATTYSQVCEAIRKAVPDVDFEEVSGGLAQGE